MALLDELECVNAESYECFDPARYTPTAILPSTWKIGVDHPAPTAAQRQAAALESYFSTPFDELPTTFIDDYARAISDETAAKKGSRNCSPRAMRGVVGPKGYFQGPSKCAAEARGTLVRETLDQPLYEMASLCHGPSGGGGGGARSAKLDVLFQMVRTDLMRYSLSNYETTYGDHPHYQFSANKGEPLPPREFDLDKLARLAKRGIAQWKLMRHHRQRFASGCDGVTVVPLAYEDMDRDPKKFQIDVLQSALRAAAKSKGVPRSSSLYARSSDSSRVSSEDAELKKVHAEDVDKIATNAKAVQHMFAGRYPTFDETYWSNERLTESELDEIAAALSLEREAL